MEAQNASTEAQIEANAGKEIVIESKGMSYGTIRKVVGDRVKMETKSGKSKSEPVENVIDWINADYTTLQ